MSGINIPGQENKPQPSGGGIELPTGFSRSRARTKSAPAASPPPERPVAPPAPAAPVAASGQPAQRNELLFPPQRAQIQCPSCSTPYAVAVFSIIDLGVNPELRTAILSSQVNFASCPNCGAGGPLGAPLLVHEPGHNWLGIFVPATQGGATSIQMQKSIGDLTQTLMRKLPTEGRKGYLLQPKQYSDWTLFMEQLWGFEGVTPEMLRRQRDQSELLQRLAGLANDRKAVEMVLERSKGLIDRDFFALLDRLTMLTSNQGQQQGVEALQKLRNYLLETTEIGQQIKVRQDKVREIITGFSKESTREEVLAAVLAAWQGEDGKEIVGSLLTAIMPMLDYQFLMMVAERIEQATTDEDRQRLEELRQVVLAYQEQQKQAQQAIVQQVQQVLQEVLQAPDPKVRLRELAEYIDEPFLALVVSSIQGAERNNSAAAARRLRQIYEYAMEIVQESMPAEMRLLNQLLSAPDRAGLIKLLQENRGMLNKEFIEVLKNAEEQMRSGNRNETADQIKSLRAQITLMV